MLKLPSIKLPENGTSLGLSSITPSKTTKMVGQELTNLIQSLTPSQNLVSSLKKRKASTPHPIIKSPHRKSLVLNLDMNEKISADIVPSSESKVRILPSSLKYTKNITNSGSKSVKFKLTKYTRKIDDEEYVDNEEHFDSVGSFNDEKETENKSDFQENKIGVQMPERKKLVFADEEPAKILINTSNNQNDESMECEGYIFLFFKLYIYIYIYILLNMLFN